MAAESVHACFHVGLHKTGTTFLQAEVWPRLRSPIYAGTAPRTDLFFRPYALAFDAATVRAEVLARHGKAFLFSDERFSGQPRNGGFHGAALKEICERIVRSFPEAKIILFLRHQVDLFKSVYLQYVRMGGTYSPRRLFGQPVHLDHALGEAPLLQDRFSWDYYAFDLLLEYLSANLRPGHLFVTTYESFFAAPSAELARLAKQFGFDLSETGSLGRPRNEGLRLNSMRLQRFFNRFTDGYTNRKHYFCALPQGMRIARAMARLPLPLNPKADAPAVLGPALVRQISGYYADSNRRLAERHGLKWERRCKQ